MESIQISIPDLITFNNMGVYKITFDTGHFYFGSSANLIGRFATWKSTIRNGISNGNSKLYPIIKDVKSAKIEIVEFCDKEKLKEREDFYLKKYFPNDLILNKSKNAYGGAYWTQAMKDRLANDRKNIETPPELKPIFISITQEEWEIVYQKIKDEGKKDLSVFIKAEIRNLNYENERPVNKLITRNKKKICKRPYIPLSLYEKLKTISDKMNIPVSAVVKRLIIQPLLTPKY